MIYKNNKAINEWYFNDAELIKVYKNGAICYYKIVQGATPHQEPCFAVVEDITQYSDTEFVDVYDKATDKWYKLNNLDQYEEYGVYGSGRNITYYEGKLTIDGDYEYEWDGSQWSSLGEVSGSTATLPDVPFMLNYNAKDYDATNRTLPKTDGQLRDSDAVCNYGYHIVDHSADGYITVTGDTRMIISGTPYMNRNNTQTGCTMTIVSKVKTTNANSSYSILTNRNNNMNWMWRYPSNGIFLHGSSSYNNPKYLVSTTGQPITASIRISYDGSVKQQLNDWTNNGSYNGAFQYGSESTGNSAMFCDYTASNYEFWKGDFYWVYMSFNVLTDEQIQQVINYNEGGTEPVYPQYYTEKGEPENNVVFTDMTDALAYQCPWVGMDVTIDNTPYLFGDAYEWLTKYGLFEVSGEYICDRGDKYEKMEEMVRNIDGTWSSQIPAVYEKGGLIEAGSSDCSSRLPDGYTEVEYISSENSSSSSSGGVINTGVYLYSSSSNSYQIAGRIKTFFTSGWGDNQTFINIENRTSPYNGMVWRYNNSGGYKFDTTPSGNAVLNNTVEADGTSAFTITSVATGAAHQTPLGLFASWQSSMTPYRFCKMRVYSMEITLNGTLVRNFVPAVRESDSKAGLYDIVNDVFYISSNNYNFIAGDPV